MDIASEDKLFPLNNFSNEKATYMKVIFFDVDHYSIKIAYDTSIFVYFRLKQSI